MQPAQEGARLVIGAPAVLEGLEVGDSVAVNGACLTAVEVLPDGFAVDAWPRPCGAPPSAGSGSATGSTSSGRCAWATASTATSCRGTSTGSGRVEAARPEGESAVLEITAPADLLRYVVEKGSIAVDGVSLTVAGRSTGGFTVALIPHTMAVTTLGPQAVGRAVNLEVDVVAKYVESLASALRAAGGRRHDHEQDHRVRRDRRRDRGDPRRAGWS